MADMQLGNASGPLALQAATPVSGFALVNGTPNILTWAAPNDGKLHRVMIFATLQVTSAETGGVVEITYFNPGGNFDSDGVFSGNLGNGPYPLSNVFPLTIQAGSAFSIKQSSALTAGAATLWAEIWGS
jgi:hypothetical protein